MYQMVRQRILSATLDGGIVELESYIRSLPKEEKRSNATKPKGCLRPEASLEPDVSGLGTADGEWEDAVRSRKSGRFCQWWV